MGGAARRARLAPSSSTAEVLPPQNTFVVQQAVPLRTASQAGAGGQYSARLSRLAGRAPRPRAHPSVSGLSCFRWLSLSFGKMRAVVRPNSAAGTLL